MTDRPADACLHLLMSGDRQVLADCLRFRLSGDPLVLLADGVQLLLDEQALGEALRGPVFCLEPDCVARAVPDEVIPAAVARIDDAELVRLVASCPHCVSWV